MKAVKNPGMHGSRNLFLIPRGLEHLRKRWPPTKTTRFAGKLLRGEDSNDDGFLVLPISEPDVGLLQ